MISKNLKTYIVEDKEMEFNQELFKELFLSHAKSEKKRIVPYEEYVAGKLFVERSSVHNWRMNLNGPGDLEKIKTLADLWKIDFTVLLKEKKNGSDIMEETDMTTVTTQDIVTNKLDKRGKKALRKFNKRLLAFLNEFERTAGFYFNGDDTSPYDITIAYALYRRLKECLEEEYIDLATTLYDVLVKYWDGLSYAFQGDYDSEDEEDSLETFKAGVQNVRIELYSEFKNLVKPYL